jgi:TRAP-type C4-dicarboxylate transport system substrate-binding protein
MEFRSNRRAVVALACGLFAFGAMPSGASAQEVKLRAHHFLGPLSPQHKNFLVPWANKIAKESNGRLKIEVFPSMSLGGKPPQLFDQVKDGVVDIIWTLPGYTPGRFPRTEAFELPFVNAGALGTTLALQDYYDQHLKDEYKDVHVLVLHAHDGNLLHSRKPIRNFADFKAKTIRSPSTGGTLLLEALGANPYHSPVPAVPQLLSKGVIDAAMIPYEVVPPLKVHENVKYHIDVTGTRMNTSVFMLVMNKNSYAKLPADLKKVLDANSGRSLAQTAGRIWVEVEKPGLAMSKKQGNEFITLDVAETAKVKAAGEKATQRWIADVAKKGIDGAALVRDARAAVAKYAGAK